LQKYVKEKYQEQPEELHVQKNRRKVEVAEQHIAFFWKKNNELKERFG
jgi:hypothetical protein